MRITNGIMMNNSLSNINKNKVLVDKLNTQISSTKKIQRPSDDPIAAIRALRLRSTYAELEQYLGKNIEDANAWMEITEGALQSLQDVVGGTESSDGIIAYLNQGVSEYQTTEDRQKIITTLKLYKDQLYADGNSDNAEQFLPDTGQIQPLPFRRIQRKNMRSQKIFPWIISGK